MTHHVSQPSAELMGTMAQVSPPQAIVVMVVPQPGGLDAQIQVQWPQTLQPETVLQCLQAAIGAVNAQQRVKTGGLVLP